MVFLVVQRGSKNELKNIDHKKRLYTTILNLNETNEFLNEYSRHLERYDDQELKHKKKNALEQIRHSNSPALRNPFYIGLVTFEEDFLGLSDYIEKFISTIRTEEQKKILIYIALCYHFEQKSLPANLFAPLLNKAGTEQVSEWDKVDLKKHL